MFWMVLSRIWRHWSEILLIVQPETVVCWHRQGFRQYGARKGHSQRLGRSRHRSRRTGSHPKPEWGQSPIPNPLWGAPRIPGERLTLDIQVSQATVSKYMRRDRLPPFVSSLSSSCRPTSVPYFKTKCTTVS